MNIYLFTCKNIINCGNRCTGFTMRPKKESLSWALICLTLKKSASADFLFDSILASSIATEKLFMKSEYTSNTTAFENALKKTSPGTWGSINYEFEWWRFIERHTRIFNKIITSLLASNYYAFFILINTCMIRFLYIVNYNYSFKVPCLHILYWTTYNLITL